MWKRIIPLLVFVAIAGLLLSGIGKDTKLVPSPLIGKAAPTFELPDLNTQGQIGSADFAGQAYIVNVFASWCAACRIEHPVFVAYQKAGGGLPIVGLNYKDAESDARRWLTRFGNPYDAVAFDLEGRVGIDFGVYGAPETFFIDAGGVIRHKIIGPVSAAQLREWTATLRGGS